MMARDELELARAYLSAKRYVLRSTYREELVCLHRGVEDVSESDFLRELAWAVLSGGMAETVIRKKFPDISRCFLEWDSARQIAERADDCISGALRHFRHEGKIRAIATAASMLC
jgi:3-methyladenine DNA glycosylase Tag